ncbi:MAG: hypothetical protein ABR568_23980, partial [Pyrinomonadaceae bacterium]
LAPCDSNPLEHRTGAKRPLTICGTIKYWSDDSTIIKLQVRKGGWPPLNIHDHSILNTPRMSGGKPPFPTCDSPILNY